MPSAGTRAGCRLPIMFHVDFCVLSTDQPGWKDHTEHTELSANIPGEQGSEQGDSSPRGKTPWDVS